MSKLDFLKDLNDIDESLIREAEPGEPKGASLKRRRRILHIGAMAAAAVLLAVGTGVWMKQREKRITAAEIVDSEILYQNDTVTVRKAANHSASSSIQAPELAFLSETELFERCDVVLRARVSAATNIVIERSRSFETGFSMEKWTDEGCLLTLEPLETIRGELKTDDSVRVFINMMVQTSLENRVSVSVGTEGIWMLYDTEGAVDYVKALSDYETGDNRRFAILQNSQGGLWYDSDSGPGFSRSWDLDQAEAYILSLIDDTDQAPADFAVSFRYLNQGENEADDYCYRFDSREGLLSEEDSGWMEKEYGKENLTLRFEPDQELLNKLYRCCKRLNKLPGVLPSNQPHARRELLEIEILLSQNGEEKRFFYSGSNSSKEELNLLRGVVTELQHYIGQSDAVRQWWKVLEKIGAERHQARSEEIILALQAAFDEKYGPGNTPDYYLGYRIVEGGYLEIGIRNETDRKVWEQHLAEIRALLYQKGYSEGFMYYLED